MIKWDYKIGDEIEYFDEDKSYELTGYIPINKTSGLDFNPNWFTEDSKHFLKTGHYCSAPKGSVDYNAYWDNMYDVCAKGKVSHGYRLTGPNVFFLNFWRMKLDSGINGMPAIDGFPAFLAFQYITFHYIELCIKLGYDVAFMKGRSMGYTEMMGSMIACNYTVLKGFRSVITAYTQKYVDGLALKVWNELSFLNQHTDGGFLHLRMKIDKSNFKRASTVDSTGNEIVAPEGWMSEIEAVVSDDPDKLRSDRDDQIYYEESGSNKNLEETWLKGQSLVTRRGRKTGTLLAWGTGGDKGDAIGGLKDLIYHPIKNHILPHHNNFTQDSTYQLTALFQPCWKNAHNTDKRGYVSQEDGSKQFLKTRERYKDSSKSLMRECAENCFNLNEAFSEASDGGFPEEVREAVMQQKMMITMGSTKVKIRKGRMEWIRDSHDRRIHTGVNFVDDPTGHIYISEMPLKDKDGNNYNNLYIAGIDSIDMGRDDTSESNDKTSDFCIVIKRRVLGLMNEGYVCYYKDRPKDIREAYEIAYMLMMFYNCKANLEYTKITIVNHFKLMKWNNMFVQRPKIAMPSGSRSKRFIIGTPATEVVIKHELELICNFVFDEGDIPFQEFCQQICDYSYKNKRKFDIIAAIGQAEIADEDMSFKVPRAVEDTNDKPLELVGYYTGRDGYTKYGVIPQENLLAHDDPGIANYNRWLHGGDIQNEVFHGYHGVK